MTKITEEIKKQAQKLRGEGKTYKEIAAILDISPKSAYNLTHQPKREADRRIHFTVHILPEEREKCQLMSKLAHSYGLIKKETFQELLSFMVDLTYNYLYDTYKRRSG
jgi:transposase